tara:strand:+ start:119 stop:502 length:384 start_codon:yes stop_codon:yes gene_type:complete
MAFEYPSVATEKKLAKKKAKEKKENAKEADMAKTFSPVFNKKEGIKKDISIMQLDDAISRTKNSDKISKKGLKKVIAAAADDKQLETSKRSILRHYKSGGRAGYKGGKSVKKKGGCAIKGISPILKK